MIIKTTFYSDEEQNKFFGKHVTSTGESIFTIVKVILFWNPDTRKKEFHIWYSPHKMMMDGMHLRNGGK